MSAAWPRGPALLIGSLGLHLLALAAVPALLSRDSRSPLFVDLAVLDETAGPVGALGRASSEPGARPFAHGDGSARAAASAPPPRMKPAPLPARALPGAAVSPAAPFAPSVADAPSVPPPSAPAESRPAPVPPPAPSPATSTTDASTTPGGEAQAGEAPVAGAPRGGTSTSGGELTSGGSASGEPGHGGALLALARPGDGPGGVPAEYAPYLARFRQRVEEALVYPLSARRRGHAGRVEVEVLLEPSGRVGHVEVAISSSNAALDEAAVDAVRAVKPIPFPDGLPRRPLLVRLPLVFQLR